MRVLMANETEVTKPGGINTMVREIAKQLGNLGHDVLVLQLNANGLVSKETQNGFAIVRIGSQSTSNLHGLTPGSFLSLMTTLRRFDPEVINVHGYQTIFPHEIIMMVRKLFMMDIPIAFNTHYAGLAHTTFVGKHLWSDFNYVGRRSCMLVDDLVFASESERKETLRDLRLSTSSVVIPHGVSDIDLSRTPRHDDTIRLMYSGYLNEYKGVQFALEAVSKLKSSLGRKVRLSIIGEGGFKYDLIQRTRELGLEDCVSFYPFSTKEEQMQRFKETDIFVNFSSSEAFGIVVAEALAQGTPCIVSNISALAEFSCEQGCFAVNYPPDPLEVATIAARIVDDDVRVNRLTNRIRTWDKIALNYESLFRALLEW